MIERNFAWGDTIVVRQALVETLPKGFLFIPPTLQDMSYPPHDGDPELIDLLKDLVKEQAGFLPKFLFVTNGCTGALNVSLAAMKGQVDYAVFGETYFPFYPGIVSRHGLIALTYDKMHEFKKSGAPESSFIVIADSPSNPEGLIRKGKADIWDAAYSSVKYGGGKNAQPLSWTVMCGSLSKTLGLNGLRLGWVATDDFGLGMSLKEAVTHEYCGISQLQQSLAKGVLKTLNQEAFEKKAKLYIDDNRAEWARVAQAFGQQSGNTGMFVIFELGSAEKKALNKAGVLWQSGETWGKDSSWARISLGQDRKLTKKTVKDILS